MKQSIIPWTLPSFSFTSITNSLIHLLRYMMSDNTNLPLGIPKASFPVPEWYGQIRKYALSAEREQRQIALMRVEEIGRQKQTDKTSKHEFFYAKFILQNEGVRYLVIERTIDRCKPDSDPPRQSPSFESRLSSDSSSISSSLDSLWSHPADDHVITVKSLPRGRSLKKSELLTSLCSILPLLPQ